jgi:hypothetical protein
MMLILEISILGDGSEDDIINSGEGIDENYGETSEGEGAEE